MADARDGNVPAELLLNPDLSRLSFDERILAFAEDPAVPLLERVRFLGLVGDRLDDFFMSRVARFKHMLATGDDEKSLDGLTPVEQLDAMGERAAEIARRADRLWLEQLLPALEEQEIRIERWDTLSEEDRELVRRTYCERVEASILPLVPSDPAGPFPHIRNLRPALVVTGRSTSGDVRFIAVELPGDLPRFLKLGRDRLIAVEDVVRASLPSLFPGLKDGEAYLFRVTRSATMELAEADDMLRAVELSVARRPFQEVVRLECERSMPGEICDLLLGEFRGEWATPDVLGPRDVYVVDGLIDLSALGEIAELDRPELRYEPLERRTPVHIQPGMFDHRRWRDVLLRFPQDDFEGSVERFLHGAARDPNVTRIAITLYRTSKDSAILDALREARAHGKDVTAAIEVKASFDEKDNIAWARDLERDGIRVVLSPANYKVHAKIGLVVRREGDVLRRVAYIGTGNMNSVTARTYVDFGLLTADPVLTRDVERVFDVLTGDADDADFQKLIVAPFHMRERFLALIDREISHARAGRPAGIRLHINGLADRHAIQSLYRASQGGVRVDMMVRDICALRPGIPGVSENIRVVSVAGRLLHHARIYHFRNGGADEYFIGSADWRPRNFKERVEVVAPITLSEHQAELDTFLAGTLNATRAWRLQANGEYVRDGNTIAATAIRAV